MQAIGLRNTDVCKYGIAILCLTLADNRIIILFILSRSVKIRRILWPRGTDERRAGGLKQIFMESDGRSVKTEKLYGDSFGERNQDLKILFSSAVPLLGPYPNGKNKTKENHTKECTKTIIHHKAFVIMKNHPKQGIVYPR